jgi:autotransporter-associated beta strand protein
MKTPPDPLALLPLLWIRSFVITGLLVSLGVAPAARGAVRIWTGASPTGGYWRDAQNWGGTAPSPSDDLVFQATTLRRNNTNDFSAGTTFGSISFSGSNYVIRGNDVALTGGIYAQQPVGTNTFTLGVALIENQTFECTVAAAALVLNGTMRLNGLKLTLNAAGRINLSGALTGFGDVTKTGGGPLLLYGGSANTYGGGFDHEVGTLELNKSSTPAIPGELTVSGASTVLLLHNDQLSDTALLQLNVGSRLDLNGFTDTVGPIAMTGATIDTGAGLLVLGTNVTTSASSSMSWINGHVDLGTASCVCNVADGAAGVDLQVNAAINGGINPPRPGLTKTGAGLMALSGTNTYWGTTTINNGLLVITGDSALGTTVGGTVVNSGGALYLNTVRVGRESLTLNCPSTVRNALLAVGNCAWDGTITLNTNVSVDCGSGSALAFVGDLTGPGGIAFVGGGTYAYLATNANSYLGTTWVNAGTLLLSNAAWNEAVIGPLVIGDGSGTDTVRLLFGHEIGNDTPITINPGGVLDLNDHLETAGALTMTAGYITTGVYGELTLNGDVEARSILEEIAYISGRLDLGFSTRRFTIVRSPTAPELRIDAQINGGAGAALIKDGTGTLALGSSNLYAGVTLAMAGNLWLEDSVALGSVSAGTIVSNGATVRLFSSLPMSVVGELLTLHGLGADGMLGALVASGVNSDSWTGPITLASDAAIGVITTGGSFTLSGVLSGAGGLTKTGLGLLVLAGSAGNTYAGDTVVEGGQLQLSKTVGIAIPNGSLTIGDGAGTSLDIVRETVEDQIGTIPVRLKRTGRLYLSDVADTVGSLTFEGGMIDTGAGTLTLGGDVTAISTANAVAMIDGFLSLGSSLRNFRVTRDAPGWERMLVNASVVGTGGLKKTGTGMLWLAGSNTYGGLTLVAEGELWPRHPLALGSTGAGTVVSNGATLVLSDTRGITNETLVLNGPGFDDQGALFGFDNTNYWTGPITLNSDATIFVLAWNYPTPHAQLQLLGAISGPGGLIKTGNDRLVLGGSSANTYAGSTRVNEGILELNKSVANGAISVDLTIGDGVGGAGADRVHLWNDDQITDTARVTLAGSGLWELNGENEQIASLSGSGQVDLGAGRLITGGNNDSTTFTGTITGTGGRLTKMGAGTFTLSGTNLYSGLTTVGAGWLVVNGFQPASPIQVNVFGTLNGTGTVGSVTNFGILAPGTSPGLLTASNTVLKSGAGVYAIELNGPTPGTYDRVNARGVVDLTGGKLWVGLNYPPADGDQFLVISNDGADAVVGTFTGLPNGAILVTNALQFRVNYNGSDGNDVVLTVTSNALRQTAASIAGGDLNGVIDPNECNLLYVVLTNAAPDAVMDLAATLVSRTPGVAVTQPFSAYPNLPFGGRGTNVTPFQISTTPGLACGLAIALDLIVHTDNHGWFTVRLALPSGSPGTAVRFDNNVNLAIPDNGTVQSPISVTGISTPLKRVGVSLHLTHTTVEDLNLALIAPDGTTIELSSDNGATGDDYGTDCADTARTVFSDAATTSITAATAPFVGTFRPEQPLAAFNGQNGADVNGTWNLRLTDDAGGGVGTLRCWSLFLTPTACSPGSGPCETCPDRTLYGSVGGDSPTHASYLMRTGVPSTCGSLRTCPDIAFSGLRHYDAFTFINGESNACVTVALTSECELFSAAYLNNFNRLSLCANYLADLGGLASSGLTRSYSFTVRAGAQFVVVVEEAVAGTGCDYRLSVTGGSCRPVLGIRSLPSNQVLLDWSTAAYGYQLERTPPLAGLPLLPWPRVTNPPVVINSRFLVTNSIAGSNYFYILHQP